VRCRSYPGIRKETLLGEQNTFSVVYGLSLEGFSSKPKPRTLWTYPTDEVSLDVIDADEGHFTLTTRYLVGSISDYIPGNTLKVHF
jgi:hypothetical protein